MENQLIHRILRRLSRSSYHLCKAFYQYELERSFRSKTKSPILIYQMGKVGSSTIKKSLEQINQDSVIYHVHFLTKDLVAETHAGPGQRDDLVADNIKQTGDKFWIWRF